jgi:exopolysaccharide production protein ExoZ
MASEDATHTVPLRRSSRGNLPYIQMLRGVAASLVVFNHFGAVMALAPRRSWINDSGLSNLGNSGVDLFFVISGFIMVYTTTGWSGGKDSLKFLRRRVQRIYPLYWLWTTVLLALWVSGIALKTHHYTVKYLICSYLLVPSKLDGDFRPFLSQGWTLSYEMLFYLIFAVGIRIGFDRWRPAFLAGAFATVYLLGRLLPLDSGPRYLVSQPILLEFLFGVLVAEALQRMPASGDTRRARAIALLLMVGGSLALVGTVPFHVPLRVRFLAFGLPAMCIVCGAAMMGTSPGNRLLVYLGDASYSIYLTHFFLAMAFATVFGRIPGIARVPSDVMIVVLTVVAVTLCSFTYPIERRLLFRRQAAAPAGDSAGRGSPVPE